MNYFIYNNIKFLYKDINKYIIKNNTVFIELVFSLETDVFNIWESLKQNFNLTFYLYNNNFNFNFVLKECYNDNNKIILKGEVL